MAEGYVQKFGNIESDIIRNKFPTSILRMHPRGWGPQSAYNIRTGAWLEGGSPFELDRCGETEAGAIRYISEKAGVWMTLDEMLRHAIKTGSPLSEYHVYPKNRRQKLLLARIIGVYMPSAEGYPTNITLRGNGMVFTNKQIVDQDSYFWLSDRFKMREISAAEEEKVRENHKSKPMYWYFFYDAKTCKYTKNIPHEKKGGFSTAMTYKMEDGHTERVHAHSDEKMIEFLNEKLQEAESRWQDDKNEVWTDYKDMRIPTYFTKEGIEKHNFDQEKKAHLDYKKHIDQISLPPKCCNMVKFCVETSADLYMCNSDGVLTDQRMREKAKDDFDYPKHPKYFPKHDQVGHIDYVKPQERLTAGNLLLEWKELFQKVKTRDVSAVAAKIAAEDENPWEGLN